MKTHIKNLFSYRGVASVRSRACRGVASARSRILPALIAGLGLILAGRVTAQTFTTLHTFTATAFDGNQYTNSDGATPYAGLILTNNTLYGTASYGGSAGNGTVFAVNTDGTGFATLYCFTAQLFGTNRDGAHPYASLILSGNTMYGTAHDSGSSGSGTVFKVNTNGTGFTNLHNFTAIDGSFYSNPDGAYPHAGLILSGNTLYGTAPFGGSYQGNGTLFKVNNDGTGFTPLHIFTSPSAYYTNSDGTYPVGGLILSGNTLYGTAERGGSSANGTVFKVSTNGTVFTALYSFTAGSGSFSSITNSDGAYPEAGLILSGNTLYGTAYFGGSSGVGTVFKVNTDGTGFTNLHSFTAGSGSYPIYTNNDGALPRAELFLSGNTLYGTTTTGSSSGTVLVGASQEDSNATGVNGNQSDNSAYASGAAYIFNGLGLGPSLALARDGSGGYFLGFNGVPDLTYRLQRAPSVTGPWSAIVTNTAPASGLIEYHETSPPPGAAFYRTLTP